MIKIFRFALLASALASSALSGHRRAGGAGPRRHGRTGSSC